MQETGDGRGGLRLLGDIDGGVHGGILLEDCIVKSTPPRPFTAAAPAVYNPRMNTQVDLLASYWTLAVGAVPHTGPEYSAVDFRIRVEEAGKAGFTGMGIWHADLEHTLRRYSLADMRKILTDNGIRHVELEFLTGWFNDGEEKARSDVTKQLLFEAAAGPGRAGHQSGRFQQPEMPDARSSSSASRGCAARPRATARGWRLR